VILCYYKVYNIRIILLFFGLVLYFIKFIKCINLYYKKITNKCFFSDRTSSQEFFNELNNGVSTIQSFIKCIKLEIIDCSQLIDALELATSYYAEHINEVKNVARVNTIYLFMI